ncbi:Rha family transcriptional regulator [Paraburkholderia sediminicola]|uniref:hypothetical protein n=1 Tax=Paraburkholderia sediminicola TaxID=458836 RepID=UPI0038B761DB
MATSKGFPVSRAASARPFAQRGSAAEKAISAAVPELPSITLGALTMSSKQIAELINLRHDNVKRTIETLSKQGVIESPQIEEIRTATKPVSVYVFSGERGKRDSIIVVAQLSPEFTAKLVDRWQELELRAANPAPQSIKTEEPSLAAQYKAAIPVAEAVVELGTALGWTLERSQAAAVDVIHRKMGVDIGMPADNAPTVSRREAPRGNITQQSTTQLSPLQQLEYVAHRGPQLFRTQTELAAASGSAQTTISRIYRRDECDWNPTTKTVQRIYEAVRRQEAIAGNPSGQMFLPLK